MTGQRHVLESGTVVHHWRPERPVGTVVLQHGFGEYAERYVEQYAHLVSRLLDAGLEAWALDLWGHGRSPGRRGVASVRLAVLDHLAVRRLAAASGLPVLLVGHSLGGLVTAASAARDGSGLAGVVLLAPALERPAPPVVRRVLGAVAAVAPTLPIPRRRRPVSELSTDPTVGRRARADQRMHGGQVSVLLAATALDEASFLWAALPAWRVPTLAVHGTDTPTPTRRQAPTSSGSSATTPNFGSSRAAATSCSTTTAATPRSTSSCPGSPTAPRCPHEQDSARRTARRPRPWPA